MTGLSDSERISMIRSAILIQITMRVTYRQTELAWHIRAIAYYNAVARKKRFATSRELKTQ